MTRVFDRHVDWRGWLLVVVAGLFVGCGDSTSSEPTTNTTEVDAQPLTEQQAEGIVTDMFESPEQACAAATDAFLDDNYGSPGREGRRECERVAAEAPEARVKAVEVTRLTPDEFEARVTDTRGNDATMTFVRSSGRWLFNQIE